METMEPRFGPAGGTILDATGRRKAYRPLPPEARAAALSAGLVLYDRGEYFDAHEILEPAWMGTDDPAERDLYQGLIKLAAAYVHAVRGNPRGWAKNLRGARERLARAGAASHRAGIDAEAIVAAIDAVLAGGLAPGDAWSPIPITRRV
jgi:predicted metal-dependent hydrolase